MKIRILTGLALVLSYVQVHASYVFSCDLAGLVASEPMHLRLSFTDRDETSSEFLFKVLKAQAGGRADSDCEQTYKGKTIKVTLNNVDFNAIQFQKQLRLNYFIKDWSGITQQIRSFRLLD